MSDISKVWQISVPPGNGSTAVTGYGFDFGDYIAEQCLITWPSGCAGLVGVRLEYNNTPAYPNQEGTFWLYDGYTIIVNIDNQPTTGRWSAAFTNSDVFYHGIQFDFRLNYVPQPPSVGSSPLVAL